MRLKVFTLRLDPATGAFDDRELVEFQAGREILDVTEFPFQREGQPTWGLLVRWRPAAGEERWEAPRRDWRADLDPPGQRAYDALREWRGRTAKRDGLPPYAILQNREMAELSTRRPDSLTTLRDVAGIGDAKCRRWGEEILAVLATVGKAGADGT